MKEYLDFLFADRIGFAELRYTRPGYDWCQQWYQLGPDADTWLEEEAGALDRSGFDVYVGVLPRTHAGGKAADVTTHTTLLWADVDAKDRGKHAALGRVLGFDVPPSALVDSGHGYHAYWRLDGAVAVEGARDAMKGIARAVGGDQVHDPSRLLRIPGTTNRKDPAAPVPVRLLLLDDRRRYAPSDFDDFLLQTRALIVRGADYVHLRTEELPSVVWALIEDGRPEGQRSEAIYRVCAELVERGWSDLDITDMIMSHPRGIGAKVADMSLERALGYIARTLRNVHHG